MSGASHTPGPWGICPSFGGNPDAFSISVVGDDRLIATAWDRTPFDEANPAEANARLIAAAPELLEALEYLVSLGGGDCLDIARAAIAKARGES